MNKKFILCFIFVFTILTDWLYSQQNNKLTPEQWAQDIDTLLVRLPKVHVNPYHKTSKEEFENYADELKSKLSGMTDDQILAALAQMVAMIGDGHTVMDIAGFHDNNNTESSVFTFHTFPLEAYMFDRGIFIIYADENNRELTGKKLVKINNIDIGNVIEKIKPIVPRDNEFTIKFNLPFILMTAEYLNGLGICPDNFRTDFTFEDNNGKQITKTIEPLKLSEYLNLLGNKKIPETAPLYMLNDEKNYWYKYIDESKLLYINIKRVLNDPSDSLKYFCKWLEEFINTHDIDKTVIDIRNNGGGNNAVCQTFVDMISRNQKINQKGKLFTVIGRQTFSAASYFTTKLEFNTNTTFIGEPTGANPNHYGDNRPLILPNSGLTVRLSSIYWENSFPSDKRESTEPEISVNLTPEDYFSGKDPVLEAVLNYKYKGNNYVDPSAEKRKTITGKYIIEPLQLIEIKESDNKLILYERKPDFIGRNVSYIFTPVNMTKDEKYFTGINGLTFAEAQDGLKFTYRGFEWVAPKADSSYKTPEELFGEGKTAEAINMIKDVKKNYPDNVNVSEGEINKLGYDFVNKKDLETAIEIFKLNTELYPYGFNTFDSLGEVYLMAGNNELAIINYKRSVELNDRNENAKKIIEKLSK